MVRKYYKQPFCEMASNGLSTPCGSLAGGKTAAKVHKEEQPDGCSSVFLGKLANLAFLIIRQDSGLNTQHPVPPGPPS